jgi:type IV pilus assembly protein PilA
MLLKLKKKKKGFTLIELIVVVAVLAILAALAVPQFIGMQDRARDGVYTANASTIAGAINIYNASVPTTVDQIAGTEGWASISDTLNTAGLLPKFSGEDSDGSKGFKRVVFVSGIATVDPSIAVS